MNRGQPTGELLEPFRHRRRQSLVTSFDDVKIGVSHCVASISRVISRERSSSIKALYHTKVEDEFTTKYRPPEEKFQRGEMSNHHQRVAIVVRDDKMFRNLQKEMRQNSRTGYGSNQLVQRLVKQGSTATMLSEVQVNDQKGRIKGSNQELTKTRR